MDEALIFWDNKVDTLKRQIENTNKMMSTEFETNVTGKQLQYGKEIILYDKKNDRYLKFQMLRDIQYFLDGVYYMSNFLK